MSEPVRLRGRSKLSTFMKTYRGYARGGGGEELETTVLFFLKSTFDVNHRQQIHILQYAFGEGGLQKSTLCTLS